MHQKPTSMDTHRKRGHQPEPPQPRKGLGLAGPSVPGVVTRILSADTLVWICCLLCWLLSATVIVVLAVVHRTPSACMRPIGGARETTPPFPTTSMVYLPLQHRSYDPKTYVRVRLRFPELRPELRVFERDILFCKLPKHFPESCLARPAPHGCYKIFVSFD